MRTDKLAEELIQQAQRATKNAAIIEKVVVSEAGASVYSASVPARFAENHRIFAHSQRQQPAGQTIRPAADGFGYGFGVC